MSSGAIPSPPTLTDGSLEEYSTHPLPNLSLHHHIGFPHLRHRRRFPQGKLLEYLGIIIPLHSLPLPRRELLAALPPFEV